LIEHNTISIEKNTIIYHIFYFIYIVHLIGKFVLYVMTQIICILFTLITTATIIFCFIKCIIICINLIFIELMIHLSKNHEWSRNETKYANNYHNFLWHHNASHDTCHLLKTWSPFLLLEIINIYWQNSYSITNLSLIKLGNLSI
jgi:uncharacterized membrane protein YeiB